MICAAPALTWMALLRRATADSFTLLVALLSAATVDRAANTAALTFGIDVSVDRCAATCRSTFVAAAASTASCPRRELTALMTALALPTAAELLLRTMLFCAQPAVQLRVVP